MTWQLWISVFSGFFKKSILAWGYTREFTIQYHIAIFLSNLTPIRSHSKNSLNSFTFFRRFLKNIYYPIILYNFRTKSSKISSTIKPYEFFGIWYSFFILNVTKKNQPYANISSFQWNISDMQDEKITVIKNNRDTKVNLHIQHLLTIL